MSDRVDLARAAFESMVEVVRVLAPCQSLPDLPRPMPPQPSPPRRQTSKRRPSPPTTAEGRQEFYARCWLRAFRSQNGVLARQRMDDLIYNQIKHTLTKIDYELIPSGNPRRKRDVRWRKHVEWAHHYLAQQGLIERVSLGVWKLTENGVAEAGKAAH